MPWPIPQRFAISPKAAVPRIAMAALLLAALCAPLAFAAKDETILVSLQSSADGGAAADGGSLGVSISADGRYVAFDSGADNLSGADVNGVQNVFVRDLATETTTLVSRQSAADGGAGANRSSSGAVISADGRFVAFGSGAENLSGVDAGGTTDVFVRDLATETTTLVSRQSAADGGAGADGLSFSASISADGRYVAFQSDAGNLSGADDDRDDVFVRDLQTETTTLVSRQSAADGGAGADGPSSRPSISADGRSVGFDSQADNLSAAAQVGSTDAFVRDLQTETTTLVSRQSTGDGGAGADGSSLGVSISADGSRVAFESFADNLSGDDDAVPDVFVHDLEAGTTTLVSRQSAADGGAGGGGSSFAASISADGRYVAFESEADNLSTVDDDGSAAEETGFDVFVRDLEAATTTLVSRQSAAEGGAGGDANSNAASISADGRLVTFTSDANNLSAADDDTVRNAFLRDVLGEPAAPADTTPPALELKAKKRQRIGRPIRVNASCDEACTVVVRGTAKRKGGKKLQFRKATAEFAAGVIERLKLKPSRKVARKLDRAGRAKVKIIATATDTAGNEARAKLRVDLRRRL